MTIDLRADDEVWVRMGLDPAQADAELQRLYADIHRRCDYLCRQDPDQCASDVMLRLLNKMRGGACHSLEEMRKLAFGIAKNVGHECRRRAKREPLPLESGQDPRAAEPEDREAAFVDVEACLALIRQRFGSEWEMLVRYYKEGERDHSAQARELGIKEGALRVRVYRLRRKIFASKDIRAVLERLRS